jgi:hypothetical protein
MFIPRKSKKGHILTVVSRKSVNGFIEHGLRIIAATHVPFESGAGLFAGGAQAYARVFRFFGRPDSGLPK